MRMIKSWQWVLVLASLGLMAGSASGLTVLLSPGGNPDLNITPRLIELGHTVVESDPACWDALFDYSAYDVVAFEYGSSNPADITHLVDAVDADATGVVIFRASSSDATTTALGLIASSSVGYQSARQLSIIDNSHPITENLDITTYDLGYTNMCYVTDPGVDTTTLANGPDGAALVVHNTRRVVVTPFYGHFAGYDNESVIGRNLTDRCLTWAADEMVQAFESSWGAVKSLYAD